MFPFHLLRSFYPFENPIGFGAVDFVELALAALLVLLVIARPVLEPVASKLALRTGWCMLLLGLLPIALRLVLLVHYPVPTPYVADEFSYILLADTLRHFRLTNPPHALPQFFETYFVLQQPTYSSIYALGQGLVLALGLDHARLGAARRAVGGDPVRPPQPVDEQLLGRRGLRGCGLSRVWIVAPAEGALAPARRRSAGRGDRNPSAHAAL
jgi:hypothetical protein